MVVDEVAICGMVKTSFRGHEYEWYVFYVVLHSHARAPKTIDCGFHNVKVFYSEFNFNACEKGNCFVSSKLGFPTLAAFVICFAVAVASVGKIDRAGTVFVSVLEYCSLLTLLF